MGEAKPLPLNPSDALFCPVLLPLVQGELDKAALTDTAAEGDAEAEGGAEPVGSRAVPLRHAVPVGGAADGVPLSQEFAVADTEVVVLPLCENVGSVVAVMKFEAVAKEEPLGKDDAEMEALAEEVRDALGELLPTADRVGDALIDTEALEERVAKVLRETPAEAELEAQIDPEKEAFGERVGEPDT